MHNYFPEPEPVLNPPSDICYPPSLNQHQHSLLRKTAGGEPIDVRAAGQAGGVEDHFVGPDRQRLGYERSHCLPEEVVDPQCGEARCVEVEATQVSWRYDSET